MDGFSHWAIEGARRALVEIDNPLRLNFFAFGMRILLEHTMDTLSPNGEVVRSSWFRSEKPDGKPTRKQRVVFAIQGGLSEALVRHKLKLDPIPLRRRLLATYDSLNKHVHGREETAIWGRRDQNIAAGALLAAVAAFFEAVQDCRAAVVNPIVDCLDEASVDALLSNKIRSVEELTNYYSVDVVDVKSVEVQAIRSDVIRRRGQRH